MNEPSDPKPDYSVGYGRPPTNSRFKPGQSGNPAGRRKGQPNARDLVMREAARLVKVKRGDEVETVTKHEVVVRQLWQMAMQGDLVAMRLLFSVMNSDAPAAGEGTPEDETAKLSLPARPDDDAIRRMLARFQHLQSDGETTP
jgi:hypothetical protein